MVVVACIRKITIQVAANLCPPAIRIVVIPRMHDSAAVNHLSNRAEMIACVIIIRRANLYPLSIIALGNVVARVTLFTRLRAARTPDELLRARHVAIVLFYNFHALTQSTVRELAPVRATGDGGQAR